jgi:hypothetical protein
MKNLFSSYADSFNMRRVSLLIVDEVYNCVGCSMHSQIMRDEYGSAIPTYVPES